MLDDVKLALRYKSNIFDNELYSLIETCQNDLVRVGIAKEKVDDPDATILHAIICYCKWQLNYQQRGLEWGNIYKDLRKDIALDGDYRCIQSVT